jgi:hypothetical protein
MPSQIRERRQVPEQLRQARQPEPAALDCWVSSVVSAHDAPGRRPKLLDHRPLHQLVLAGETVTIRVEPEEVLIADARGNVTPSQMVERKLMALLCNIGLGVSLQRTDGPADFRGNGNPPSPSLHGPNPQRDQTGFAGHWLQ